MNCYLPCLELNTLYAHPFCHGINSEWNVLCLANAYTCHAMKNIHYFVFHHQSLAVLSKVSIANRTMNLYLSSIWGCSFYAWQLSYSISVRVSQAVPSSTRMSWRFSSSCCFNHAQETSDDTILASLYPLLDRSTGQLEKQLGKQICRPSFKYLLQT